MDLGTLKPNVNTVHPYWPPSIGLQLQRGVLLAALRLTQRDFVAVIEHVLQHL